MSRKQPFPTEQMNLLETEFLQEYIQKLQQYIHKSAEEVEESEERGFTSRSWDQRLAIYQNEIQVLQDLLHDQTRQKLHLEDVVGSRLRNVNRKLARLTTNHTYGERYWKVEIEHEILVKILNDWWRWLKEKAREKELDLNSN